MELVKVNFEYSKDITAVNRIQYNVHLRLYEGYINKINEIDKLLAINKDSDEANATYSKFRGLKRGETYALNGVILHEYYFENMGAFQNGPNYDLISLLVRDFGSYERWQQDFISTANASRGWAILCYDLRSRRLRNISLDAHDFGNIARAIPLLVLDVYEHAYFLEYADRKADYIHNFMVNINWDVVIDRMSEI